MTDSSRETAAGLRARLDERRGDPSLSGLADELFAAADLIGSDALLRGALSDAGQPAAARQGTVEAIFGSRLSPLAVQTLSDTVGQRWPDSYALVDAVEQQGAEAAFLVAEQAGRLETVESELFAFSQALGGSSDLQMALTNPASTAAAKAELIRTLLGGRASEQSVQVLAYALGHLRGRRADSVLTALMALAAEQRGRSVAQVRVARALDAEQEQRLARALSALNGRDVRLNVAVDPALVGGISVRIGGQVIDATVASRFEQARRALVG